jgi:osmotically-inducible protein OsmY
MLSRADFVRKKYAALGKVFVGDKMKYKIIGIMAVATLLSGCDPVSLAVGAGASLGVASTQEGGVRGAVTDDAIQLKIADLWIKKDFTMFRKLNATVKEGRVLLTGSVPNPDMRVEAVRLAWQADGVRQVLNEISVDEGGGVTGAVVDGWITSNIKAKLMMDKYVQSINYNIDTVQGNVYVMGVAQNQKELTRVMDYARNAGHVHNVVSYVRLRYEDPDNVAGMAPDNG